MHDFIFRLRRLFAELRRRRVFRVAAVYAVVAFVLLEVMDPLFPALLLPDWADTLVAVLLLAGFPLAILLAWAYETGPGTMGRPAEAGAAGTRPFDSVAVLPFSNLSGDSENEYLSDGITEELINALNQVKGLRVASRGSCFRYKGKAVDARDVGSELGARAVLEGSVRRSGDRLRVNVQLANALDGYNVWSGSYDHRLTDIFGMQEEIARAIVEALRLELPGAASAELVNAPTASIAAYELYLRGRQYFHERRKKGFLYARQMFRRAIEVDPGYALAWAGLADSSAFLAHWFQDEEEASNVAEADRASRRAIELAPESGQAHASRGFALFLMKQFEEARREFETALGLDPEQYDARYLQARACYQQGDLERALELFEEAARTGEEDHEARYFTAQTLSALERGEEAKAAYKRALPYIERHLELYPDDARAWTQGAVSHSRLGNRARGLSWAEKAIEVDPEDAAVRYNVACLYALEGETDRAIACLRQALVDGFFAHPEWIKYDPDLDSLRDDPRFQALLEGA
jgi:TolB-like protein/Flp pilus assembly protein TadD